MNITDNLLVTTPKITYEFFPCVNTLDWIQKFFISWKKLQLIKRVKNNFGSIPQQKRILKNSEGVTTILIPPLDSYLLFHKGPQHFPAKK